MFYNDQPVEHNVKRRGQLCIGMKLAKNNFLDLRNTATSFQRLEGRAHAREDGMAWGQHKEFRMRDVPDAR